MQGFSKSCAVIGALVLGACGSPAELDEDSFPTLDKTGYVAGNGVGGSTQVVSGSLGGSAGAGAVASAGSGSGAGGASGSAGGAQSQGGSSSSGTQNGGSTSAMAGGCPSDITTLFARPIAQGGCTSGGGCHEAGSPIKPDLVSPNVAARLLNVASSCSKTSSGMSVQPRPYIGKDDSFLEEKIAGTPNSECGFSMPFFMPDALSAADEKCIIEWIDQVAGG